MYAEVLPATPNLFRVTLTVELPPALDAVDESKTRHRRRLDEGFTGIPDCGRVVGMNPRYDAGRPCEVAVLLPVELPLTKANLVPVVSASQTAC